MFCRNVVLRRLLPVLGAAPGLFFLSVANAQYSCLPNCTPGSEDGEFLAVPCNTLATVAQNRLEMSFAAPSDASSLTISLFDGDLSGLWDVNPPRSISTYTLYADPKADGSDLTPLGSFDASEFDENAWSSIVINDSTFPGAFDKAQAPSGHYFFRLVLDAPTVTGQLNSFKVRTEADVQGAVVTLDPQPVGFISPIRDLDDLAAQYPSGESRIYEGTFDIHFYVPVSSPTVGVWDGDFDFGDAKCALNDTDDPNTSPVIPEFAEFPTSPARAEGVAMSGDPEFGDAPIECPSGASLDYTTGDPPDDFFDVPVRGIAQPFIRRPGEARSDLADDPNLVYEIVTSEGEVFLNPNASGNQEWEHFVIGSTRSSGNPDVMAAGELLPTGIYHAHAFGVDADNFNAWYLPYKWVGVCENGEVCSPPLYPGVTATIGYWKTHPEAWPVEELTIGGETLSQEEALEILNTPPRGDKSIALAQQLIGAKLNLAGGSDPSCIGDVVGEADAWLVDVGGVGSGQRQWNGGEFLHNTLDDYNNGFLCAPHRDSVESDDGENGGGGPLAKGGNGSGGPPAFAASGGPRGVTRSQGSSRSVTSDDISIQPKSGNVRVDNSGRVPGRLRNGDR